MTRYVLPALFAVLLWWFSTGLVLCAVRRTARSQAFVVAISTVLFVVGCLGVSWSSGEDSLLGVYVGFVSALAVWGWHELTFLLGLVTGPNTTPCPGRRCDRAPFADAAGTVIYHEVAIALTGLGVVALSWGGDNPAGMWTYLILWILRLSAKMNVYLGVPNLTEEFLPAHLDYLKTYFCHRPMNFLFPFSVTGATLATMYLGLAAAEPATSDADAATYSISATLMGLALIEHWFLVLPFNSAQLWTWGMANNNGIHEGDPLIVPMPQAVRGNTA